MVEREVHWPYKSGHSFEVEDVRLDLYRLLNQFLAEPLLSERMQEDAWLLHAVDVVGHFFTVESQRILIHAAVVARVKDDNEDEPRLKIRNFETECGTLVKDVLGENKPMPLDLREACNKIIHAKKFHYDIYSLGDREIVNPTVYLYGSRGKVDWKATLSIVDFIKHYINNVV